MRVLTLLVAAAVSAPAIAVTAEEQSEERQKQRRICRAVQDTGTRIRPPRVCMTQEQWDQIADTAKDKLTEFQGRPNVREYTPF